MSTSPLQKVVEPVVREWLQSKSGKIDAILNLVAAQVAPLVAAQVKAHFEKLVVENLPNAAAVRYRNAMEAVISDLKVHLCKYGDHVDFFFESLIGKLKDALEEKTNG